MVNETKKCSTCKESKSLTEFAKASRNKDGLQYSCRSCNNETQRKRRAANPSVGQKQHHRQRRRKYGLTQEQYDRIQDERGLPCPLCGIRPRSTIDHDHKTGKFRGHICTSCNVSIGLLGDSIESITRVLQYLTGELREW